MRSPQTPADRPSDADGVVLRASHSHLFPGAWLRGSLTPDATGTTPTLVVFADGAVADAALSSSSGERRNLTVASYTTAAGTSIGARAWVIEQRPDVEGAAAWYVAARAG